MQRSVLGENLATGPAYPQLIQTTRLVYSLQDRGSQLSRMQRIYPNAW